MESNILIDVPKIYIPHYDDQRPYQIWKGSRFSAKSWTKALFFLLKCRGNEYFRLVYARDTQKNVRKSQYQLFIDISKKFNLFSEFEFRGTDMQITHKSSGNFMIGGSFEQPDTLRSTADVTDFWAEEPITRTFSIDRESFLDIAGSLRNSYGIQTKFHFTFNPIGMNNFIYEDFFSENKVYNENEVNILTANYGDNPFCPQSAKDFLNKLKDIHPSRYAVDALGHWGISENKNPWFYAFDTTKHIATQDLPWNKSDVLYLAFDFNISPMTCVVAQFKPGVYLHILKAYKIRNITIKEFCFQIRKDFPGAVFRVTADPAGNARSVGYESVSTTMHSIIRQSLNIGMNQMDKPLLNWTRRDAWQEIRIFCNSVLQHHPNIGISPKAAIELINDIEIATTIDGEDKLYKTAGDTEFGMHLVDCFLYLLTTYFNHYLKRQL